MPSISEEIEKKFLEVVYKVENNIEIYLDY